MDCNFIKLWRPYSFGGPRPKSHLAYPWVGPGDIIKPTFLHCVSMRKRHNISLIMAILVAQGPSLIVRLLEYLQ
ncbi:hypothetical protein Hanom_Chr12g01074951 [Helianthus anomalus]